MMIDEDGDAAAGIAMHAPSPNSRTSHSRESAGSVGDARG